MKKSLILGGIAIGILTVGITVCLCTPQKTKSKFFDEMNEAIQLDLLCQEKIRELKQYKGISISIEDTLNTGLIGDGANTPITTTEGTLEHKRTSINPLWCCALINWMEQSGINKGDQVGFNFSGSFPALNLACLVVSDVLNLEIVAMTGIGASTYGANQFDCTFLDMAEYLHGEGVLKNMVSYASIGGEEDDGRNYCDKTKTYVDKVVTKIENSSATLIKGDDFEDSINQRLNIYQSELPNMKMFINVGGTQIGIGKGLDIYYDYGYSKANTQKHTYNDLSSIKNERWGLTKCFKYLGLPVVHLLEIRTLCTQTGIQFDPSSWDLNDNQECFYLVKYNIVYPIISSLLVIALAAYYVIDSKKKNSKL